MKNKFGWEIKTVGKVCNILNGYAFKSSNYVDNGIRVIRITNVQKGKIVDDSPQFYPVSFESEISKFILFENDVLISLTGNVGRVGLLNKTLLPAALNQRVACLRIKDESTISRDFLFHFFNSNIFEEDCINSAQGIAQKNMSTEWLKEYRIPVPPLPTQHQIVSELDALSEIISKKKQQLEELDKLAQATFYDMFGDPVTNEKGWEVKKLGKLGFLGRGVSKNRPRNSPELLGGDTPLIQTGDIANAGMYITKYTQTYSQKGLEQSKLWMKNTLCITIAANIGKTAIMTFDACFPDSVVGFTPNSELINVIFTYYFFTFIQKDLEENAPQVAQKNINLEILNNIKVILPPILKQKEFASKIESIESQKSLITQSIAEVQQLFDYTMDKYF